MARAEAPARDVLAKNAAAYEAMAAEVQELCAAREDEAALEAIRRCAHFAWFHHPGRFADGTLENAALEIGRRLQRAVAGPLARELKATFDGASTGKRRVLHAISCALEIGGHTRLVMSWIALDRASEHSVLLTFQSEQPFRPDLEPRVREHGGGFLMLPIELSNLDAVAALRFAARRNFDLIVLHSHPDDPFPTAAFALPEGPPIALLDHADNVFWLGSSIADCVVHLRRLALEHGRARRFTGDAAVLPIPFDYRPPGFDRREARRRLGVPPERPLLVSVGTGYKYAPTERHDFLRAAARILEREPDAHLHVVGLESDELRGFRGEPHPRLHAEGVRDPTPYQRAADVYLEPFPFGSMTATLESVVCGAAPVLGFAPETHLLISCGDAVEDVLDRPADEDAYVERAVDLLRAPAQRAALVERLQPRILHQHQGAGWHAALAEIYASLDGKPHAPREIPVEGFRAAAVDRAVGRFWAAH